MFAQRGCFVNESFQNNLLFLLLLLLLGGGVTDITKWCSLGHYYAEIRTENRPWTRHHFFGQVWTFELPLHTHHQLPSFLPYSSSYPPSCQRFVSRKNITSIMFRFQSAISRAIKPSRRFFHSTPLSLEKLNVEGLAKKVDLKGQNVLVRVDLNVPLAKVGLHYVSQQ